MKKKIILSMLVLTLLVTLKGCDNSNQNTNVNNNGETNNSTTKLDHKIYKYIKVLASNSSELYYETNVLFDDPGTVSNGDTEYKPRLLIEFDTTTGKAKNIKFYAFFLDYEDDEWVNKAIEKYNESSGSAKTKVTDVTKGRVNEEVSYLSANISVDSYGFNQYILTYLIQGQDIDEYKDSIYYSRLYNYDSEPPHEEGDNYFEESLEGLRIEWSDKEISAY